MHGKMTSKSRPLSAKRKRNGERRSITGKEGKKKREKTRKKLRIFFVCCEFNIGEWYLFIHLLTDQHLNGQIIHTIQLVSCDIFNNYKDNVL